MTEVRATNPTPPHGWTCFHCGDHFEPTFAGQKRAEQHFGPYPTSEPACSFEDKPRLIRALRYAEQQAQTMYVQKTAAERELEALRGNREHDTATVHSDQRTSSDRKAD